MSFNKTKYQDFYEKVFSPMYDIFLKSILFGMETQFRLYFLNQIKFYKKDKILDLCCGTGTLTKLLGLHLLKNETKIVGVDLHYSQIKIAKNKNIYSNVSFKQMDASNLKFNNETFDKVIISLALHELPQGFRKKILKEAYRVLKKTGTLALLEHHEPRAPVNRFFFYFYVGYWLPYNPEAKHARNMLKNILAKEVMDCGYTIVKFKTVNKLAEKSAASFHDFFQIIIAKKN